MVLSSASINVDETNNKIIGAMVALLSDAAEKAKEELNLTEMISMVIKYKDATLLCRQIVIENFPTIFFLAALAPPSPNEAVEKYQDDLMNWAVTNGTPFAQKTR